MNMNFGTGDFDVHAQADYIKALWLRGTDPEMLHYATSVNGYDDIFWLQDSYYDELDAQAALEAEADFVAAHEAAGVELGEETPAMVARGAAKQRRSRRRHVLNHRVNLDENCPDSHSGRELHPSIRRMFNRADRHRFNRTAHLEGLHEWEMQPVYDAEDYWDSNPEELQWREADAYGDGSWEAWTPSNKPCHNDAMGMASVIAFQQAA